MSEKQDAVHPSAVVSREAIEDCILDAIREATGEDPSMDDDADAWLFSTKIHALQLPQAAAPVQSGGVVSRGAKNEHTSTWPIWLQNGPVKCRVWCQDNEQKVESLVVAYQKMRHLDWQDEIETFITIGKAGPAEWLHAEPISVVPQPVAPVQSGGVDLSGLTVYTGRDGLDRLVDLDELEALLTTTQSAAEVKS